jgi:hypothetical protein
MREEEGKMKTPKPYAELVNRAEESTRAIKDPELRRVAFERVLDDLLSGGGNIVESGRHPGGKVKLPGSPPAKTKKFNGPKGYVRELIDDGFFKKPKTIAEVKAELSNRGHHIALTSLSGPLQTLCQDRLLRRNKGKPAGKAKKATFNYSEW